MKQFLKGLHKYWDRFGLLRGSVLYFQIKTGRLHKLSIPGMASPISIRPGTSDILAFNQIFLNQQNPLNFLPNASVIIDGGANIGFFTLQVKHKYPRANIYCIEPDPENFTILQKNVSGYAGIQCLQVGLWNRDTRLKVFDKFGKGKWAMVVEEDLEGGVPALSIDSLMSQNGLERIDILKLDIETSEKFLFASNYEKWLPKTKVILIEFHDWMLEGCSRPFFEAINSTIKSYSVVTSSNTEYTIIVNNDLE